MTWPGSHSQGVGELGLNLGSLKLSIGLVTRSLGVGKGAGQVTRVGYSPKSRSSGFTAQLHHFLCMFSWVRKLPLFSHL